MDKELEIMTVDGVDYAILKEVKNVGTTYVFLSNVANSEDMMIRKSVNDEDYVPLDGDKELILSHKQEIIDMGLDIPFKNKFIDALKDAQLDDVIKELYD